MSVYRHLLFFFLGLVANWSIILDASHECSQNNLMRDLLIVDYWNNKLNERFPVIYNNLYQGGYFTMPSARMGVEGEVGIGYAYVPPYRMYNLRCQVLDRLEMTGSYRVFHGIDDPILSPFGFGDMSDKGANFKFSLFSPEDSGYKLPGLAFGYEDFMGTKGFHARYVVLTHVFMNYNLEVSLGYGANRIRGFFGGFNFMPFRFTQWKILHPLSLVAEYDATPYKSKTVEKHPKGRIKNSPINFGFKYKAWNILDVSLSYIRGDKLSFSAGISYNLGETQGFLPKIDNKVCYISPVNTEPMGVFRSETALSGDLLFAFQEQQLTLLDVYLSYNKSFRKVLRLNVLNETYRLECEVRERLNFLLAALIPTDIEEVFVVINSEGFPIQEYHYRMDAVRCFGARNMGPYELSILTPLQEVSCHDPYASAHIFSRNRHLYNFEISPDTRTVFGSSSGKFKYSLGLNFAFNGFLWQDVFYNVVVGCTFGNNMGKVQSVDRLNPSQLINVRSDIVKYYMHRGFCLEEGYLQKNWNLGHGFYARLAAGYFEIEYGGAATEFLYYPVGSNWAIGIEAAVLKKREYTGIGFTNKIRKFQGTTTTYHKFLGSQGFLNLHYDWKAAHLEFKISAGRFLARDWGVRNEITRYFPSGLRISVWYTLTNGNDHLNGKRYYDKGINFSLPFDIFYTYSERSRWNYGLSAWLRDVGIQGGNGQGLYEMISDQRQ